MKNVNYLELQYGEVSWRSDTLAPAERFINGTIQVPDRPGFGIDLNDAVIRARSLPL
jgi:L-alanine-DL-glutamate epimerase-like enolase superfamily enzyme